MNVIPFSKAIAMMFESREDISRTIGKLEALKDGQNPQDYPKYYLHTREGVKEDELREIIKFLAWMKKNKVDFETVARNLEAGRLKATGPRANYLRAEDASDGT